MSEALPKRLLIFLDFDGVLHPRPTLAGERFCRLPLLEGWLRERPHVDVVISSSWRFANSLTELRSIFSEDLQSRVISTTSAGGDAGGSREHQIRQWLQFEAPGATWIAIDDSSWLFSRTERLVLCDPNRALTAADLQEADRLLALPAETESPINSSSDSGRGARTWPPLPAFDNLDDLERWLLANQPPENT